MIEKERGKDVETNRLHCDDVLGQARGDERDPPGVRSHLLACGSCRLELSEVRLIAQASRTALVAQPVPLSAAAIVERARRPAPAFGLPSFALAAAAGAAVVALYLAAFPAVPTGAVISAEGTPRPAWIAAPVRARPVVVEIGAPANNRMPYVVESAAGNERGELDLSTGYVIETVPADPVVLDTF